MEGLLSTRPTPSSLRQLRLGGNSCSDFHNISVKLELKDLQIYQDFLSSIELEWVPVVYFKMWPDLTG